MDKINLAEAFDLLGIDYPKGESDFYVKCPFCGHLHKNNRKTLNVNLNKSEDGVFSCLRCNMQGHVITFWREYKGFSSNKEAAKDIFNTINGTGQQRKPVKKQRKTKQEPKSNLAPIETRSKTFNALLDSLVLTDVHKKSLKDRGLSDLFIKKCKYRSIPQTSHQEIATKLLDQGYILDGVPGFYMKDDVWRFSKNGTGIMIPQRDGFGRIQGFQLRMDNTKYGKYLNLTSGKYPYGTPTKAFVHMSFNREKDVSEVILTEGALKADVITYFTNVSTISVPGVNSTRFLKYALKDLKDKGTKKIGIAFDMDLYENPNVYRALCRLKSLIRDVDIPFCMYQWDKQYKGLDDYLNSKYSQGRRKI